MRVLGAGGGYEEIGERKVSTLRFQDAGMSKTGTTRKLAVYKAGNDPQLYGVCKWHGMCYKFHYFDRDVLLVEEQMLEIAEQMKKLCEDASQWGYDPLRITACGPDEPVRILLVAAQRSLGVVVLEQNARPPWQYWSLPGTALSCMHLEGVAGFLKRLNAGEIKVGVSASDWSI